MSLGRLLKDTMHLETSELLVTPKVTQFLRTNSEGILMNKAGTAVSRESKALVAEIMDKAFAGNSDRSGRFGASGRGSCHRAQLWTFLGMPTGRIQDPELTNLFNDGKFRHLRWQIMMLQSGAVTDVEVGVAFKKYRMSSSIDAVNDDDGFIVELKGDRNPSRMMQKPGAVDEKHNLQIHSYFMLTGYDRCSYIVEDKQSQVWREVIVHRDAKITQLVEEEMMELNEAVDLRAMPPMLDECALKQGKYKTCGFAAQCFARRDNPYFPDKPGVWKS